MNTIYLKRIGLLAQYCLWSTSVSASLGMSHTRLVFFMIGFMILISLSGMHLRDVLNTFESMKSKILYVLALCVVVSFTLYAF